MEGKRDKEESTKREDAGLREKEGGGGGFTVGCYKHYTISILIQVHAEYIRLLCVHSDSNYHLQCVNTQS